VPGKGDRRTRT